MSEIFVVVLLVFALFSFLAIETLNAIQMCVLWQRAPRTGKSSRTHIEQQLNETETSLAGNIKMQ